MVHVASNTPGLQRGLTIIEVLVSIATVSVLLSILLPAMRSARVAADDTASLASTRGHLTTFAMYAADHDQRAPCFTSPHEVVRLRSPPVTVLVEYFLAYGTWNMALADAYYDGKPASDIFFFPGYAEQLRTRGVYAVYSMYWYATCFLAAPEYWTLDRRTGPEQWRATRLTEVNAPSGKGLLYESKPGGIGMPDSWYQHPGIGFVDGSARRIHRNRLRPGHPNGTGVVEGGAMIDGHSIMHTINGVRGLDID